MRTSLLKLLAPVALIASALLTSAHAAGTNDGGDKRSRTNYLLHCAGCHQPDGSGNPDAGIPNMRGQVGHFLRLPEGRAFLVQVPGTSQSSLSDADVASLLNWMVQANSANEIPADFKPYTPDEVTRLRAEHLPDAPGTRNRIAAQLRDMGYAID